MTPQHPTSSSAAALLAAGLLGAASGLRSQTGVAAVVLGTDRDQLPGRLRSNAARVAFGAAALGELAADKYPKAPDRTAPASLAARLSLGGVAAGLMARDRGAGIAPGVVVAAGAAAATTFGGLSLRRRLSRRFPPLAVALAEDALAVGLAVLAVRAVPLLA